MEGGHDQKAGCTALGPWPGTRAPVQGPWCSESRCTALGALWGDCRGQRAGCTAQDSGAPAYDPRQAAPRPGGLHAPWSPCGDPMSMTRPSATRVQDPPLLCLVWSRGKSIELKILKFFISKYKRDLIKLFKPLCTANRR